MAFSRIYKYKKQHRYKGYDYSGAGMYFVTICTKDQKMFLGKILGKYHYKFIEDAIVVLSIIGKATEKYWLEIPKHFPFVELDEFIIMPNHVHGIIVIKDNFDVGTQNFAFPPPQENFAFPPPQENLAFPPPQNLKNYKNKFGPQSKNLSSIIRGFKIGVTKHAKENNIEFVWQSRFHDRIIRNEKELFNIRSYIINNPLKWEFDHNNADRKIDTILNN